MTSMKREKELQIFNKEYKSQRELQKPSCAASEATEVAEEAAGAPTKHSRSTEASGAERVAERRQTASDSQWSEEVGRL